MERTRFLWRGEHQALRLLRRTLGGTAWEIHAKPRLKTLIRSSEDEDLSPRENRMLWFGEPDYVVVEGAEMWPQFIIEFDDSTHERPRRAEDDRIKDALCLRAGLPVLRVRADATRELEHTTVLEWVLERFIAYKTEVSEFRRKACDPPPEWRFELSRLRADFHDPSMLAGQEEGWFLLRAEEDFDERHPFPALGTVLSRLSAFGIERDANYWSNVTESGAPLLLQVRGEDSFLRAAASMNLALHELEADQVSFSLAVVRRSDGDVLQTVAGATPFPTQASEMLQLLQDRLGTNVWSMGRAISQYEALVEIERWSQRTLTTRFF